jgi:protein tyrosine phosphatase (PTP) superfamily phosphohydrolase (DUF442 family)
VRADKVPAPHPERTIGTHLKAKGIPNFGQVTPNLYRGAQPSGEGIKELKKMGVDIVVDLRGAASKKEESAATKLGMQYVSVPSHCEFPRDEPFARLLKVIRDNPGKKILVHCRLAGCGKTRDSEYNEASPATHGGRGPTPLSHTG